MTLHLFIFVFVTWGWPRLDLFHKNQSPQSTILVQFCRHGWPGIHLSSLSLSLSLSFGLFFLPGSEMVLHHFPIIILVVGLAFQSFPCSFLSILLRGPINHLSDWFDCRRKAGLWVCSHWMWELGWLETVNSLDQYHSTLYSLVLQLPPQLLHQIWTHRSVITFTDVEVKICPATFFIGVSKVKEVWWHYQNKATAFVSFSLSSSWTKMLLRKTVIFFISLSDRYQLY